MRRPEVLRRQSFMAASAALAFAIASSYGVFVLLGGGGRIGFDAINPAGLLHGLVFLIALMAGLSWVRVALRLPGPVLLSFGLVAPPRARQVAQEVPIIDGAHGLHGMAAQRIVILQEAGVPIGVSGMRRDHITSWEEVVKVDGDTSVTDLRALLAHEKLVVVTDGQTIIGVVTQEAYLAGLWGRVR
jgi:hypothetical protein